GRRSMPVHVGGTAYRVLSTGYSVRGTGSSFPSIRKRGHAKTQLPSRKIWNKGELLASFLRLHNALHIRQHGAGVTLEKTMADSGLKLNSSAIRASGCAGQHSRQSPDPFPL